MSRDLRVFNRQRVRRVDVGQLRKIVGSVFDELARIGEIDFTIHLVGSGRMAELNKQHLNHEGPTDVITLDYGSGPKAGLLAGEVFVCMEIVVEQARQFRAQWQHELMRYVIHGILHLAGHDDLESAARRKMKREENRLLKRVARRLPLRKLERK